MAGLLGLEGQLEGVGSPPARAEVLPPTRPSPWGARLPHLPWPEHHPLLSHPGHLEACVGPASTHSALLSSVSSSWPQVSLPIPGCLGLNLASTHTHPWKIRVLEAGGQVWRRQDSRPGAPCHAVLSPSHLPRLPREAASPAFLFLL